jgi:hypothetical protein
MMPENGFRYEVRYKTGYDSKLLIVSSRRFNWSLKQIRLKIDNGTIRGDTNIKEIKDKIIEVDLLNEEVIAYTNTYYNEPRLLHFYQGKFFYKNQITIIRCWRSINTKTFLYVFAKRRGVNFYDLKMKKNKEYCELESLPFRHTMKKDIFDIIENKYDILEQATIIVDPLGRTEGHLTDYPIEHVILMFENHEKKFRRIFVAADLPILQAQKLLETKNFLILPKEEDQYRITNGLERNITEEMLNLNAREFINLHGNNLHYNYKLVGEQTLRNLQEIKKFLEKIIHV